MNISLDISHSDYDHLSRLIPPSFVFFFIDYEKSLRIAECHYHSYSVCLI